MGERKEYLSVGEVSKRSGVAISTLHFYEKKGLIKSFRNSGNQRRYYRHELRIISYIRVAQKVGLSLEEIKTALNSIENKSKPTLKDWKKLSQDWEEVLEGRISLLLKLKSQLNSCIGCGCLSLSDCPLRNPEDILFSQGSGPRLLL